MAQLFYEDFEGSDGTAMVATTNTAFAVISGTGNTSVFDTEFKMVGNSSGLFTIASSGVRIAEAQFTDATALWAVFYLRFDALPTANAVIAEAHNNDLNGDPEDDDTISQLRLNTTGALVMRDKVTAESGYTPPTLDPDTWYRVAHFVDVTNNIHRCKVYLGDEQTVITNGDSGNIALTGSNSTYMDSYYLGLIITGPVITEWFDDFHIDDTTEWAPEAPASEAPVTYGRHVLIGG